MKRILSFMFTMFTLTFISCAKAQNDQSELNPMELFNDTDAPVELVHKGLTFQSPWGYNKPENASRLYPLLVSGKWGEGEKYYTEVARDFPAFVIDYQKTTDADGQALAYWIKSAIDSGYRIDLNRIYLTGFSWGGSGSYPLAKGMFAENMYFAAIIRIAGQSQPDLGNDIAKYTAVWYHIGLSDIKSRVTVARKALEYMRNYACNDNATETKLLDSLTGFERNTLTLNRAGLPVFKYSEYSDMGHTAVPCYKDDKLFKWLFSHSLKYSKVTKDINE
ncbi:hypothetical protein [Saccharicrinis sp. FJH54]|uniref:hypothetical protein n=1 Tax=Saccharicrinis sp. FJH54 TaxID=3344665 RepID=UPI0035D4E4F8